jgi:hypothetical protein
MNLNIICLLLSIQSINGQLLLKQFRFPQNNLLNCIYKNISFNVKSKIECASYCNTESSNCDGLFYNRDVNFCSLLNLAKFDWKNGKEQNESLVYLNPGIHFRIHNKMVNVMVQRFGDLKFSYTFPYH